MGEEALAIGRIVHYVLDEGVSRGEHRPAIVIKIWDENGEVCNLQVFTDSANDTLPGVMWERLVKHDETGTQEGTWHWPED